MLAVKILTFYHIVLEMALLHNSEICKRCWIRILRSNFREMSGHWTATTTPKPVKRKLRSQAETVKAFMYVVCDCFYSSEMSCREFVRLVNFLCR